MPRLNQFSFDPDSLEPQNDGELRDRNRQQFKEHQRTLDYEQPSDERVQEILATARKINGRPQPAPYDEFTVNALQNEVRHLRAYADKIEQQLTQAVFRQQLEEMLATGSSRGLKDNARRWIWNLQLWRCGRRIQNAWERAVWYRIAILEQTEGSENE
jgi:hypothetical protein